MKSKKTRNKKLIIIIILICIIIIETAFITYKYCIKLFSKSVYEDENLNNINAINKFIKNENLYIIMKNNNSIKLSYLDLYIVFYNNANIPIKVSNSYVTNIDVNQEFVVKISDLPKKYKNYEVVINNYNIDETEDYEYSKILINNLLIKDDVYLQVTNNTNKNINMADAYIIFYSKEEIIDIRKIIIYNLEKESKQEFSAYEKLENNEYDNYEILINNLQVY